jgi:hypothetical protein
MSRIIRKMNAAEMMAVRDYWARNMARPRAAIKHGEAGGDFGTGDPNSFPQIPGSDSGYDESQVYNPERIDIGGYENKVTFNLIAFNIANTSTLIVPENLRRVFLAVQNQDTAADLYVNFQNAASVAQGLKLVAGGNFVFDVVCPRDAIYAFFNNAAVKVGIAIEGVRTE